MPTLELYGSIQCPCTRELRDWLEWARRNFLEYDVDREAIALARLQSLTAGFAADPFPVEDGKVVQVGWQVRSCLVSGPRERRAAK